MFTVLFKRKNTVCVWFSILLREKTHNITLRSLEPRTLWAVSDYESFFF